MSPDAHLHAQSVYQTPQIYVDEDTDEGKEKKFKRPHTCYKTKFYCVVFYTFSNLKKLCVANNKTYSFSLRNKQSKTSIFFKKQF